MARRGNRRGKTKRLEEKKDTETHCEPPVDHAQELALEHVELADGDAADAGVERVCAEGIAEGFAGDGYGCDDETVAGERREREGREAGADLIDVVQRD